MYSWFGRKKDQSAGDYQNMSQEGTWLNIAGTYSATVLSAVGMVGLPGLSYGQGMLVGLLNWGCTVAFIVSGLFFGPRLRKFGKVTFGEYFEARFESKNMRLLTSIVIIFGIGSYFISQTIGSATILQVILGVPFFYTVILSVVVIIVITLAGGARSVTIMDTLMFSIMAIGLGVIFAPAIIAKAGFDGMATLAIENPKYFTYGGLNSIPMGTIVGLIALWSFGFSGSPVNLTRAFIAKDNRHWLKGLIVGFIVTIFLLWTTHPSASFLFTANPDITPHDRAIPWAALNFVGPVVGIAATIALTSACISTANTQLLVVAQSIVNDFIGHFKSDMNEEKVVKFVKWAVIIVGIIGLVLAMQNFGLIAIFGQFGSSVFAAAFFPVIAFGLYCKWVTKQAAAASIIVGLVADTVLSAYPLLFLGQKFAWAGYLPFSIHPVLWSLAASIIALLIVSAITKPTESQIRIFDEAFPSKGSAEAALTKVDDGDISDSQMIKWGWLLIILGVLFLIFTIVFARFLAPPMV